MLKQGGYEQPYKQRRRFDVDTTFIDVNNIATTLKQRLVFTEKTLLTL